MELVRVKVLLLFDHPYQHGSISQMALAWAAMSDKTRRGEMSREEYDRWRCNYPKFDTTQN